MAKSKTKAPLETLSEAKYLTLLAEQNTPVALKLDSNVVITGSIAAFTGDIVRVNSDQGVEHLVEKEDIKYLWEVVT
jgi:hypothetical protein